MLPDNGHDAIRPVHVDSDLPPADSTTAFSSLISEHSDEPKHLQDGTRANETVSPLLRYRKTSIWLLAFYLPFLVLPWILTCIMIKRPPSLPSYYNQKGEYGRDVWNIMRFWMGFVRVLNAIANILVVPVISALLAQGAVVYAQRRKTEQKLSLRQIFALSDRGWADIPILWGAKGKNGSESKYLWLAAGFLALSFLQAAVQQALVASEVIMVMTCADNPLHYFSESCGPAWREATILGYDPEPKALAYTPQKTVIQDVVGKLASVNSLQVQEHLWHDPGTDWTDLSVENTASSGSFYYFYMTALGGNTEREHKSGYFVSALPNNTQTGILRQHAMRLNSSADCTIIDESAFPTTCPGSNPVVASYISQDTAIFRDPDTFGNFTVDVCVPGDAHSSPWTLSRDRQDISEDLFIKVHVPWETYIEWTYYGGIDEAQNFTVQCTTNTTRGYFELGNIRNNFIAGPLIEKWPDKETMWNDFNDYLSTGADHPVPSTINDYPDYDVLLLGLWHFGMNPFDTSMLPTPGPLMTAALAMFGNDSFFYVATNSTGPTYPEGPSTYQQICQADNIPFTRLDTWSDFLYDILFATCNDINNPYNERLVPEDHQLDVGLYQWMSTFSTLENRNVGLNMPLFAKEVLEIATFFANEAWLMETVAGTSQITGLARHINTSPGMPVYRPVIPVGGLILITILIGLQVLGLIFLAWYIYSVPTWTGKLDSYAVGQLARSVDDGVFVSLGKPTEESLRRLNDVDGLVGIADGQRWMGIPNETIMGQKGTIHVEANFSQHSETVEDVCDARSISMSAVDEPRLVRGGPGLITRKHAPMKKRTKPWRRKTRADTGLEKGIAT